MWPKYSYTITQQKILYRVYRLEQILPWEITKDPALWILCGDTAPQLNYGHYRSKWVSRHFYFSSWIERGRKMLWCSGTAAFNGLCVSPAFACCMLCRHVIQSNMKKRYICVAYICLCCSEISFLSLAGIRKSPVPVLDWWGCGEILQPSIPPLAAVLPAGVKAGLFPSTGNLGYSPCCFFSGFPPCVPWAAGMVMWLHERW